MKRLAFIVVFIALATSTAHAAEYRLPFEGRWFVMAGGDTINVNHHMVERSQWFAVDFMKTGGAHDRSVAMNSGKSLEDFYSWAQPVLSPADGVVRKVHDGEPDNPIGTRDRRNAFGNYVVIQSGPTEFVYVAHLQKGSDENMPDYTLHDLLGAIDKCDQGLVTRIVESGVSVNASTSRGCTPLMFAVMPNEFEEYTGPAWISRMVDHLLGLGADPSVRDDFGMTAYDYACQQLDPNWKGKFGGSAADQWKPSDIVVLEGIKDRLRVDG